MTVRVGSSFYDADGQLLTVESINLHSNYSDPETLENNIAVLILSDAIVSNFVNLELISLKLF